MFSSPCLCLGRNQNPNRVGSPDSYRASNNHRNAADLSLSRLDSQPLLSISSLRIAIVSTNLLLNAKRTKLRHKPFRTIPIRRGGLFCLLLLCLRSSIHRRLRRILRRRVRSRKVPSVRRTETTVTTMETATIAAEEDAL